MAVHPATAARTAGHRRDPPGGAIDRRSFEYLLTTAQIESNFNPYAQASTSSANGLFQFIDQTWLGTMKQDGAALGLGRYADAIYAQRRRPLRGDGSAMRARIHAPAQRSDSERNDGRRVHAQQCAQLVSTSSAASRPTANSTSRISSAPTAPAS